MHVSNLIRVHISMQVSNIIRVPNIMAVSSIMQVSSFISVSNTIGRQLELFRKIITVKNYYFNLKLGSQTCLGSGLTSKHYTRLERITTDKHSSLIIKKIVDYDCNLQNTLHFVTKALNNFTLQFMLYKTSEHGMIFLFYSHFNFL